MIEAEVRGMWGREPGNSSSLQKVKKTGHIFPSGLQKEDGLLRP